MTPSIKIGIPPTHQEVSMGVGLHIPPTHQEVSVGGDLRVPPTPPLAYVCHMGLPWKLQSCSCTPDLLSTLLTVTWHEFPADHIPFSEGGDDRSARRVISRH